MGEKGSKLSVESQSFLDRVKVELDALGGISSRKMFGGFGIFHDGAMFGIVSKTSLFFKVDDSTRGRYRRSKSKQHGKMPYFSVPEAILGNRQKLHNWAKEAVAVAHRAKK